MAHVKRRDVVPHLMAWIVCAVWWFHPLAWSAARRMRSESEKACDDLVLKVGTRASRYADDLLDIVTRAGAIRAPAEYKARRRPPTSASDGPDQSR